MLRVRIVIESDGKPTNVSYSVKKDGKEYPVTVTGVPNAGTTIWRRIDERATDMIANRTGRSLTVSASLCHSMAGRRPRPCRRPIARGISTAS
jgi:hypothetical protein